MIPLYFANASGNTVLTLDEPGVDTDQGAQFLAWLLTAVFDLGPASGFATLRHLAQALSLSGAVTLDVTPFGDGTEYVGQRVSTAATPLAGPEQVIECPFWVPATRFQFKIEVPAHTGETALGECDHTFVARRARRGR